MIIKPDKPHVSASQLDTLTRCGQQYAYRYLDGLIIPPGVAATRGKGFHAAAEANGKQKIESHEDMKASDLKEVAAEAFDAQLNGEGIWLSPEEASIGNKMVIGHAKDSMVEMADCYATDVAPAYQPTLVEAGFRIPLSGPRDFVGFIDLIDDAKHVIDLKTGKRAKSQADADNSLQLTAYAAGHRQLTGEDAASVGFETISQTKNGPKRTTVLSNRTAEDFDPLAARVNAAVQVIESGNFLPASPDDWICSTKWCGYTSLCPFFQKERTQ